MARSAARRQRPRRVQEIFHAGRSLSTREVLFVRMVIETGKYLEMRDVPFGEDNSSQMKVQRGIIRGMALSITKMFGNGYEPYWTREVKAAEKKASRLAREWIDDGKSEEDGWWVERRGQFWRSRIDQAVVGN